MERLARRMRGQRGTHRCGGGCGGRAGEEGANVPLLLITPPDGWEEGRRAGKRRGGREHEANGACLHPTKKKRRREEKLQQEMREGTGSGWKNHLSQLPLFSFTVYSH